MTFYLTPNYLYQVVTSVKKRVRKGNSRRLKTSLIHYPLTAVLALVAVLALMAVLVLAAAKEITQDRLCIARNDSLLSVSITRTLCLDMLVIIALTYFNLNVNSNMLPMPSALIVCC